MISAACQTAKAPNTGVSIGVSELTIADIHRAFQSGEYTSEQLVQAYLDRIKKVNPQIHALSFINPEALMEARKLDEEYRKTKVLRPLHGIPIIVKDNINTAGLPTTGGSLALENFIPAEDAFIIKKLREAGAIVIAKSNMAEWAFSPRHSISSTYGETLNPYNTEYVPAGSSGGTGASVAASLGTIGLGTDTGNSIRGPSSHNALVGFRTTIGLVSRADIIPLYLRNDVVGAMCRTVEDATLVLEAMTGYDPTDPVTKYSEGKIPANYTQYLQRNGLKGARIGVLRELSEVDPDPEVKALFEKSIRDMESLGAVMVDAVTVPDFAELRKNQWCADFRADLETYLATYVKNDTIKTLEDIIRIGSTSKLTNDRVAYSAEHSGRAANPEITCADPYTDQRRIAFRKAIEDEMDRLKLDAIIYPTWNNKPAKTSRFNEDYKGDNSQIISPHTGQPAFTVPMGFTTGNLPAGVQFLGRMYAEPTLIKLVYSYEQGTKHRKPPVVTK
jgi:Asp-tRNA(Asn)/Glu-tRNA(Gln) amidotransferase A subunit family amidase